MPYPQPKGQRGKFFLEGDLQLAEMTLFIFGGLPFVFVCALSAIRVEVSSKILLLLLANMGIFAILASVLTLVRHKETKRPWLTLILSILGVVVFGASTFWMLYLFFLL